MSLPDSILAAELRAARPGASPELRTRVLTLAAREPEPARRRLNRRRAAFVLAPAAVVATLAVAVAGGILGSSSSPSKQVAEGQTVLRAAVNPHAQDKAASSGSVAPSATRPQDYEAEMRLRVRGLSAAT